MKQAFKLVVVCMLAQLLGALIAGPIGLLMSYVQLGVVDKTAAESISTPLGMVMQFVLMAVYLWKKGFLTGDSRLYAPTGWRVLGLTILAGIGSIVLSDALLARLDFLPNLLEETFTGLLKNPIGIFSVVLLGPVAEELFFRGAITKVLLRRYAPWVAVVVSGLLFGLVHINPPQVVGAALIGILLGWLYWRTGSLIPCILLHVVNNGCSTWFMVHHPEIDSYGELLSPSAYCTVLVLSAVLLVVSVYGLVRITRVRLEQQ